MTIVRTFTWGQHAEDSSVEGWIMKGMDNFDPVLTKYDSVQLTHDILEHFNSTDTSLEAEFLAFGSMLYLRGEGDWWAGVNDRGNNDPGYVMSSDMAYFVRNAVDSEIHLNTPPRRPRRLDDDLEHILHVLRNHARRFIADFSDDALKRRDMRTMLDTALDWVRVGYRKANRRWRLPIHERIELFDTVMKVRLPSDENDGDGIIECVKVHVDPHIPRAWVTVHHYDDPYA